jgi:hypothetical protein
VFLLLRKQNLARFFPGAVAIFKAGVYILPEAIWLPITAS